MQIKKGLPDTIIDEVFETNYSFRVKQHTTEKLWFLFFKSFLLVLEKLSISLGDWVLGYHSIARP